MCGGISYELRQKLTNTYANYVTERFAEYIKKFGLRQHKWKYLFYCRAKCYSKTIKEIQIRKAKSESGSEVLGPRLQ